MKFKVGDTVVVTAGKDKGKQGKILEVLPKKNAVVVQGANEYTRHFKAMMGQAGRQERKERPLDVAKVAIYNPETKQADRLGVKTEGDKKVRIYKKTGKQV